MKLTNPKTYQIFLKCWVKLFLRGRRKYNKCEGSHHGLLGSWRTSRGSSSDSRPLNNSDPSEGSNPLGDSDESDAPTCLMIHPTNSLVESGNGEECVSWAALQVDNTARSKDHADAEARVPATLRSHQARLYQNR
jgi:hypothetical protein